MYMVSRGVTSKIKPGAMVFVFHSVQRRFKLVGEGGKGREGGGEKNGGVAFQFHVAPGYATGETLLLYIAEILLRETESWGRGFQSSGPCGTTHVAWSTLLQSFY